MYGLSVVVDDCTTTSISLAIMCSYVTGHAYGYNVKDAVVLDTAQGVPAA
jgi:hypothetical protein